jgi:hypothetical protein
MSFGDHEMMAKQAILGSFFKGMLDPKQGPANSRAFP